jgi:Na+-transporting methylmalonyl-CoA/oxaloacetate decarboxylase gamma subunit
MMADTVRSALLISAIGMGLVFGVILLLWGLIALMVRVAADRPAAGGGETDDDAVRPAREASDREGAAAIAAGTAVCVAPGDEQRGGEVKARAAAAAVGAYLADQHRAP